MLDLNQRPKDSGLCPFLDSLDYAFAMGIRAYRRAPSSLYTFPHRRLGSALPCTLKPSGFAEFDAIHTSGFPRRCTTLAMSPLL